jgi:hypothetical protein
MFVLALFLQGFQHRSTCVPVSRTTNRHWRCLRWLSSFKKIELDPVMSSLPVLRTSKIPTYYAKCLYFFLETPKTYTTTGYVLCSRIFKIQQQDNICLLLARSIENGETPESCSLPLCAPPRNTVRSAICVSKSRPRSRCGLVLSLLSSQKVDEIISYVPFSRIHN